MFNNKKLIFISSIFLFFLISISTYLYDKPEKNFIDKEKVAKQQDEPLQPIYANSLRLLNKSINNSYDTVDAEETIGDVPVFIQFFDWFHEESWQEDVFVDPLNWSALGITGNDRSSEDFYFKQFTYIKSLGIDSLAWEFHPRRGQKPTYPSDAAIRALKRSGLKIAPFYDFEIALKVRSQQNDDLIATLSNSNEIKPDSATINFMTNHLKDFFNKVPNDLLALDKKGRQVIFVFGYGFDDSNPNPNKWSDFAEGLVKNTKELSGFEPAFYWTTKNSVFQEHLFLHHRENFIPFQFVLDTPQSQFGHESITWNFGFDNLAVQKRDNLQRVIRLDERYVKEMGWLSKATNPSLVFIYSWNEPFEGSMLIPTKNWGDTKALLAKSFIARLKMGKDSSLQKTLLIVDDLDEYWGKRKDDWHLVIQRELLLYSMRRFIPQSAVRMVSEISPELLDDYYNIVDISSGKDEEVSNWLLERMKSHKILVFDPLASTNGGILSSHFASLGNSPNINGEVELGDNLGKLFVRDDVNEAISCENCRVIMTVKLPTKPSLKNPLIVTNEDDIWVNAYNTDERILKTAFEKFYNKPMNISIMYGEGLASQRLEINPTDKKITKNQLNRYSINGHWELPNNVYWYNMPPEIDYKYFDFIFGLDI